jgi:hypothetical protein
MPDFPDYDHELAAAILARGDQVDDGLGSLLQMNNDRIVGVAQGMVAIMAPRPLPAPPS